MQSAVIPWRRRGEQIELAMITSVNGRHWVFPKGLIDPGETAAQSARREAEEEAGLDGEVSAGPVGRYRYDKWGGVCDVEVFLMRVVEERSAWPEQAMRRRRWFTLDEALGRVEEDDLRAILRAAVVAVVEGDGGRSA